jgi:methionyl aminopeptidase
MNKEGKKRVYNRKFTRGMTKAGKRLAQILSSTEGFITDNIDKTDFTKNHINDFIVDQMKQLNCEPLFLGHDPGAGSGPYPKESIVCLNEEIVHSIPTDKKINKDDLITVDIGIRYEGYCADAARTYTFTNNPLHLQLKNATEEAFFEACKIIKAGIDTYEIGKVIKKIADKYDTYVMKDLTGHGIGTEMWEPPHIFQYPYTHDKLVENQVICIEPIFSLGTDKMKTMPDKWTLVTKDGSLAAQYENMLLVTKTGCQVLTI